jgi:hypothetical protein
MYKLRKLGKSVAGANYYKQTVVTIIGNHICPLMFARCAAASGSQSCLGVAVQYGTSCSYGG